MNLQNSMNTLHNIAKSFLNDDKVAEIKEILESNEFDNVFGQNGSRSHA